MSLKKLCSFVFVFTVTLPRVTKTLNDEICDAESDVSSDAGVVVVVSDVHPRVKREFVPYKSGKVVAGQVSNALDRLLVFSGYDKRIRPQVWSRPASLTKLFDALIVDLKWAIHTKDKLH